jgi:hypothetical protein
MVNHVAGQDFDRSWARPRVELCAREFEAFQYALLDVSIVSQMSLRKSGIVGLIIY